EAANVGKSVTLPSGEIHVNQAFCDMLGYDPEELREKNWQDLTLAEDVPETERCIAPLLGGREDSTRFEKRYVRTDGGIVWADVSVTLIRDSRNQPFHFITTVVDITERKQHEAQIEHLNRVLRAIRDVNQLITHEEDPESLLARSCEILISTRGYRSAWAILNSEDGVAQTVAESGIGDDFAPVREAIVRGDWPDCCRQARERPGSIAPIHDTDCNCKDCSLAHTYRDTAALAGALRHGGRDYGSLVVALPAGLADDPEEQSLFRELVGDVAYALHSMDLARKRKKAEEALRSSEEHFRLVVENAPDAIFVQTQFLFAYINPAAVQSFGAESADQLLGLPVLDRFEPRYHDLERERIRQLNEEKTAAPMLKQVYLKMDGSPFHVEVAAVPIHWQGQDGALVFFRDITERESLEAQLRRAQKLETVGRLAGGVAHDFNNILTTIMGTAGLMLGDVPADDPLRKDIQEIQTAGERAASLTRQLLAFSRKQVLQPEVINLNDTIQSMTKMLRRMIPEDIEVQTALAEDLDQVEADEGQIEQVIMNLAINARDAMPAGGRMSIETANADLDETYARSHASVSPGSFVKLSVSDTGIGMSKEVQEQVFEPFFTTKDKGKGTGLGLSTVYGIVKQSNGSIWVYSEPDKGTTIKIYLPRVETSRPEARPSEKDVPDLTGAETVLVVEDDAQVRSLAVKALKGYGYTVLTAENSAEALKVATDYTNHIHLVLTDVIMPGMNGKEMAEQLKAARPEMMVLYMSGYTDNAIVHHGVLDPGVAFIGKPFTLAALGRKVREVLDS
ncbi:MAG: PAS domain S-box protein, partial [Desulfovermiculus sp.]